MAKQAAIPDPTAAKLDAIESLLQDVLILQGARAGMSKEQVREMLGVGARRVTRIWKHIDLKPQK